MAASTGIVVTAGGLSLLDHVLTETWDPGLGLRIFAGTVAAAFASAGLDKVIPGFGTGAAVILLVAVVLKSGPRISEKIFPPREGFGAR
jgi:hypothetical protein